MSTARSQPSADAGPNSPRSPVDLYLSARDHGWTPPGVRMGKGWDPCSMEVESARRYLGSWAATARIIECIAWFDLDGVARVIVADFDSGRRIIVRLLSRSSKVQFARWKVAPQVGGEGSREEP